TRGHRFQLAADLVDDDDLRVVVLDGFDHHLMLALWPADLHTARTSDSRMRHVAVAADFVRRIDDHDALGFGQHTRSFAQQGGFAHARRTEHEDALAGHD